MNKYEAMFIIKPDLTEEEKKALFATIQDTVSKNNGQVTNTSVWAEKHRMTFPIKKQLEGTYYLVNFGAPAEAVTKLKYAFKLNEQILRVMIVKP